MRIEKCAGCGIAARVEENGSGGHPVVCMMNKDDVAALDHVDETSGQSEASKRGFVHVPVCKACHENPEHRVFPLKGHFFMRDQAASALVHAGSNAITTGGIGG
jgi:hypothetical protein